MAGAANASHGASATRLPTGSYLQDIISCVHVASLPNALLPHQRQIGDSLVNFVQSDWYSPASA